MVMYDVVFLSFCFVLLFQVSLILNVRYHKHVINEKKGCVKTA